MLKRVGEFGGSTKGPVVESSNSFDRSAKNFNINPRVLSFDFFLFSQLIRARVVGLSGLLF